MQKTLVGLGVLGALLTSSDARAQVGWESPLVLPPRAEMGLGLYLMDVHGGDIGVMGTWRASGARSLGLRFGVAEDRGDDVAAFGGVDLSGLLTRVTPDFPLDIDWVLGVGISVGDAVALSLPAGLTIGHSFTGDGVRFTPFATPRVVLDAFFGDDDDVAGDDDDLDIDVAVDIGVDLQFQPTWLIRFAASLGRDAIAIGFVF